MIVAARLVRDRRWSTLWWALGFVGLTLFTAALYPSIKNQPSLEELLANMPQALRSAIGYDAAVPLSSPAGYLQARLYSTLAPLLAVVFGIGAGAGAIGGSEEAGTLELLLANPVTRGRVLLERYLATFGLLAGLVAVLAVALLILGPPFGALEGIPTGNVVGACVAVFALGLLHGSLAFAIGAAAGRRGVAVAVATAVAVAGYLVETVLAAAGDLGIVRQLSPWHWYLDRNLLAEGATLAAILLPLSVSAVLVATAWALYRRRDLR
ncbi:MAG TPA: ABC transporter permease subunit [Actinomycetes bacterium]|nr:ABC transporter permease subunit [Actinomycetes bacterium]